DASKSPERSAARFRALGIEVSADEVITSGSLLRTHAPLEGRGCIVLGPEDSEDYVRAAGGVVHPLFSRDFGAIDALIVGDETGFQYLEGIDYALPLAYTKLDRGEPLRLIVPNPDLVYPKPEGAFGFAAGMIATMIEHALEIRYPGRTE